VNTLSSKPSNQTSLTNTVIADHFKLTPKGLEVIGEDDAIPMVVEGMECGRVESKKAEKQSRKPAQEGMESGKKRKKTSSSSTTLLAGSGLTRSCRVPLPLSRPDLFERDFPQPNALDRRPDNSQAAQRGA
jgi:hypothetical protein